jgi:hypothetical protein
MEGVSIQENEKELLIILTDITLHTNPTRKPASFARGLSKSVRSRLPGRTYVNQPPEVVQEGGAVNLEMEIPFDDEMRAVIERAKELGKQIRLVMPKDGVPVFLGKDAVEKFAALNRQKNRGSI